MEQCRAAAEHARHAALAAERDAREAARAGRCRGRGDRADRGATRRARAAAGGPRAGARSGCAKPWPRQNRPSPPCPIRQRSSTRSKQRAAPRRQAASAVADKRARSRNQARETAADRERLNAAAREQGEWRKRHADADKRLRGREGATGAAGRGARRARRRACGARRPDCRISSAPTAKARCKVGEAAAAEREAEAAVVDAAAPIAAANERSATAREHRAAASARAEAQQARSAEFARVCVEKFECVPQRLPEKLGFERRGRATPTPKSATLERLTAERERIGPVNLVAEQELAELDESAEQGRRGSRGADPGDPSPARLDRQSQPRRPGAAARRLSRRSTRISAGCSRPCSKAARRISSWSRATIRSKPASRSWPSRRASDCRR